MKLKRNKDGQYYFYCPGCHRLHHLDIETPNPVNGAKWQFNGDLDSPTVHPAIINATGIYADPQWPGRREDSQLCESRIRDGHIQFRSTSTHLLSGYTVPLPDLGNL